MKPLGIIRYLDPLGRVVIPANFRRTNGWEENQPVELFAVDGGLFIKAYGREEEKKEILEQLEHLKNSATNEEVLKIASKTMEFIKKQGV